MEILLSTGLLSRLSATDKLVLVKLMAGKVTMSILKSSKLLKVNAISIHQDLTTFQHRNRSKLFLIRKTLKELNSSCTDKVHNNVLLVIGQ